MSIAAGAGVIMLPHITRARHPHATSSDVMNALCTIRTGASSIYKDVRTKSSVIKLFKIQIHGQTTQWMLRDGRSLLTFGYPFSILLFIAYLWPTVVCIVAFTGILTRRS